MSGFLSVRRRDLIWALALIVVLSAIWIGRSDPADAGASLPEGNIDVVFITSGLNFPDALTVAPMAATHGAPIILVPTNPPIPTVTQDELLRLEPSLVLIVGGTVAVSAATETAIEALLPTAIVERASGTDRYETNTILSEAFYPVLSATSVHASAFRGDSADTVSIDTFGAYGSGTLYAPISLPNGAHVTELVIQVFDDADPSTMTVSLISVNEFNSATLASITTSTGAPGYATFFTTTIADPDKVDNVSNGYFIEVTGSAIDELIINVIVKYELGIVIAS